MHLRQYIAAAALLSIGMVASSSAAAPAPIALSCATGRITWLSGHGTPHMPLLIHFAGRPVGGGSVNAAGAWSLPLQVGQERPGLYSIEVRSRNDHTLVGAFQCAVGIVLASTATPAQPTATAASTPAPDFDRNGDGSVTCADFDTQIEAQRALAAGYTDLDGNDQDGLACESLP